MAIAAIGYDSLENEYWRPIHSHTFTSGIKPFPPGLPSHLPPPLFNLGILPLSQALFLPKGPYYLSSSHSPLSIDFLINLTAQDPEVCSFY